MAAWKSIPPDNMTILNFHSDARQREVYLAKRKDIRGRVCERKNGRQRCHGLWIQEIVPWRMESRGSA